MTDFEDARQDLLVAGVAAACTIALTLGLRYAFGVDASLLVRLVPIYVYFGYVFTRKGGPYAPYDTPRNWTILTGLVTIVTLAYAVL